MVAFPFQQRNFCREQKWSKENLIMGFCLVGWSLIGVNRVPRKLLPFPPAKKMQEISFLYECLHVIVQYALCRRRDERMTSNLFLYPLLYFFKHQSTFSYLECIIYYIKSSFLVVASLNSLDTLGATRREHIPSTLGINIMLVDIESQLAG